MPGAPFDCTTATDPMAEAQPALDLGDITSPRDLIRALRIFTLDGTGIIDVKKAPQYSQITGPSHVVPSTRTQTSMNGKTFKFGVGKLVDGFSALKISKPARKPVLRQAPMHPYKCPKATKSDKILFSHGMAKKGTSGVPHQLAASPGRVHSVASDNCTKMNNATISLLSNAASSLDTSDSPFNWSNAWLSSAPATSPSPVTVEAQYYVAPASKNSGSNLYMADKAVASASVVNEKGPSKQPGKVKKVRVPKGDPYTKNKADRKKRVIKEELGISKFDSEVASLVEMLSHCQLSNGSARLTRSKARAARKAEACHDSGYEGGLED